MSNPERAAPASLPSTTAPRETCPECGGSGKVASALPAPTRCETLLASIGAHDKWCTLPNDHEGPHVFDLPPSAPPLPPAPTEALSERMKVLMQNPRIIEIYIEDLESQVLALQGAAQHTQECVAMVEEWDAWALDQYGITYTEMRRRIQEIHEGKVAPHAEVMARLRAEFSAPRSPEPTPPTRSEP